MRATRRFQWTPPCGRSPPTPWGSFPIFRWEHRLDDFQTGELNRHWHSEFLFGLVTEGTLDYYYNPTSSHASHATLEKGDGCLSTPGCPRLPAGHRGLPAVHLWDDSAHVFFLPGVRQALSKHHCSRDPLPGARGLFPQALSRKTGRFYGCSRSLKNSAPGRRTMSSTPSSWCAASGEPY